ncbi:hypothetical protein [Microbacterium sp. 1P10AE]|uniref:hypothetical protein n=1 Tax=Microbacterium sp. 1P10AE TaxID=3132286 RepID=UPI0039A19582
MTRHTILLGVEGVLLVEIDSPAHDYAAMKEGRDYASLPVPDDGAVTPDGRFFVRIPVVEGIRELAGAGADIVWHTRRLTDPDALRELAEHLGLADTVRFPDAAELPAAPTEDRIDTGPNVLWEHWKVQALIQRARDLPSGDEVVVVDSTLDFTAHRMPDGLARRSGRKDADGIGGVKTVDVVGLDEPRLDALRAWVAGGAVPRI